MGSFFRQIINRISFQIDQDKVVDFLLKEYDRTTYLPDEELDSKTDRLLKSLENSLSEDTQKLLEKKCTEKENAPKNSYHLLFTPASLNHIRYINKFLARQNQLLKTGGNLVCFFQTSLYRKAMIFKKYPIGISHIIYTLDLIWHRAFPKLPGIKEFYFAVTKGTNRVYPRPEILGRLYRCGFQVIQERNIGDRHYIVAKKIKEPFSDPHPSYGLLIRLPRIGKNGKIFNVYKFRTMHAYSEYLQAHIYKQNNLTVGGKFANDYRIPKWGRFLRKHWLDEIPMIFNLLGGDIKLIGVRPLSLQYYSLYSPELQQLRIQTKPGLLPPFYADMPQSLEEIEASEKKYLENYLRNPVKTDWKYFGMILYSIFIKRKRSS